MLYPLWFTHVTHGTRTCRTASESKAVRHEAAHAYQIFDILTFYLSVVSYSYIVCITLGAYIFMTLH